MRIDVRTIAEDELEAFHHALMTAFADESTEERRRRHLPFLDPARCHAAFEGADIVGTAAVYPLTLTIPGGEISAAGVTLVGVLPSHRRRGVLTRMMRAQLDDVRARGEPVAILWASEGGIYQRYGYGFATHANKISIERDRAAFAFASAPAGRIRLLSADEALKILPDVYERARRATPGMFARSEAWWRAHTLDDSADERDGAGPLFRAVWEDAGGPEGYVLYRVKSEWSHEGLAQGEVWVNEEVSVSPQATREIWRFVFGIDLTARVVSWLRPADDPLALMLAEPRRLRTTGSDGLWLRVVDVPAALGARGYAADGDVVLEVTDPFCAHNDGGWHLSAIGGSGRVEATDAEADIALDAAALGCVYLGGFTFAQLQRAGRARELRPGGRARADALFRTDVYPWCPEIF